MGICYIGCGQVDRLNSLRAGVCVNSVHLAYRLAPYVSGGLRGNLVVESLDGPLCHSNHREFSVGFLYVASPLALSMFETCLFTVSRYYCQEELLAHIFSTISDST